MLFRLDSYIPNRIVDVTIPKGTQVRVGIAGKVDKLGTLGGGTQVELMNEIPKSSFKDVKPIEDKVK